MCWMAAGIGAGLLQAGGALMAGFGAKRTADYNARVAEMNAVAARQKGVSQAETIAKKYDTLQGRQTAAAANAGLDPTKGSAAMVINQETGGNAWLDQMTTLWNSGSEATALENRAKAFRAEGSNAQTAGLIGAGGSILGSMAKLKTGWGS